jgi:hypothetical protein
MEVRPRSGSFAVVADQATTAFWPSSVIENVSCSAAIKRLSPAQVWGN